MDRPDPNCPPGHVRLTEEERRQTLERLSAEYEGAVREQVGHLLSFHLQMDFGYQNSRLKEQNCKKKILEPSFLILVFWELKSKMIYSTSFWRMVSFSL